MGSDSHYAGHFSTALDALIKQIAALGMASP